MTAHPPWDESYQRDTPPPWDIGRPQPVFARLAEAGELAGRVLDAGCGTGEHALLAASHGAEALGIDISGRAVARAREKAAQRGLAARFQVGDALDLGRSGDVFDVVVDSGLFHVFSDDERPRYVRSLATVLAPGGTCHLMCFSDRQPGDWGPRRVRQDELTAAFADGWDVARIAPAEFEINPVMGELTASAWLATIRRTPERGG